MAVPIRVKTCKVPKAFVGFVKSAASEFALTLVSVFELYVVKGNMGENIHCNLHRIQSTGYI